MDPLSIAAGAAGLGAVCISTSLYTFIDDTRSVDSNLTALCEEILGLSRVLDAIVKSWKQSPYIAIAQADPDGTLWINVKMSIDDCKNTLEKLERKIHGVQKESVFGRWRPTKAIKLNVRMKEIVLYRQQIQSYSSAMQSALQMINVCLLIHGQSSQGVILQSLQGLKSQIGRLESGLGSLQNPDGLDVTIHNIEDNKRISRTLQSLVKAAETFHSSASTVAGGSTVWGGSVWGEPLSEEQYRTIEGWIPPPIEEENTSDKPPDTIQVTSSSTDPSTDVAAVNVEDPSNTFESDSDIEDDLTKRFQELAMTKLAQRDYSKAEMFLRKILERNQLSGGTNVDLTSINLKVAYTCCFQGRWEEAESIILPIVASRGRVDATAIHILHCLSVRKLQQRQFQEAEKWCKRAIYGKKMLVGKDNLSYHESMALLARVYESRGDAIEAEVCRTLYSPETVLDLDPLSYLLRATSAGESALEPWTSPGAGNNMPHGKAASLRQAPVLQSSPAQNGLPPPASDTMNISRKATVELQQSRWRSHLQSGQTSSSTTRDIMPIPGQVPPSAGEPPTPFHRKLPSRWEARVGRKLPSAEHKTNASPVLLSRHLIVAIDVGVTFTGAAYAYTVDGAIKEGVVTNWASVSYAGSSKFPTVLYYNEQQNEVRCGYDVTDVLAPNGYPKPEWLKVEWFVLRMFMKDFPSDIEESQLPPLPSSKSKIDVTADFLAMVRTALLSELRGQTWLPFSEMESRIEYHFTIPDFAMDSSVAAFRSAIIQAGYIREEENARLTFISKSQAITVLFAKEKLIQPHLGDVILIVFCGGGLVNLISYEVTNEHPLALTPATKSSGDSCGATAINRNFTNLIRAKLRKVGLADEPAWTANKIYAKNVWEFEKRIKTHFRNDPTMKFVVDVGVADYPQIGIEDGYMTWMNDEIYDCFGPVVDRILELIHEQIIALQSIRKPPKYIVMAGGLGTNDFLVQKVKESVPPHFASKVVHSMDGVQAGMRGAVAAAIQKMAGAHSQTHTTKRMYYIMSKALDERDLRRYTWNEAVGLGERVSEGDVREIELKKLVPLDEPLVFEDWIWSNETGEIDYLDSTASTKKETEIITKIPAEDIVDLEKSYGPQGPYRVIRYQIQFRLRSSKWEVTSSFRGKKVGSCSIPFV